MIKTEDYKVENQLINNVPVSLTTYKIGDKYFCHISNADPGATIARGEGVSLEDAIKKAMEKVSKRIK